MNVSPIASFFKVLFGGIAKILPFIGAYIMGSQKEKKKQAEEALEDVKEAKDIRDRLDADDDFAKRVRKKYTRSEE